MDIFFFKFCMELHLGSIYMPNIFVGAAPSVPSFLGSKVNLVDIIGHTVVIKAPLGRVFIIKIKN